MSARNADVVVIETHLSLGSLIEHKKIVRFKSEQLPAAAAVPRSAAGCRRTGFSEWRPRQPIAVA